MRSRRGHALQPGPHVALAAGMRPSRPARAGGFTLVEVMVSIAILTGALVAVAQLFAVATQVNLAALEESFATVLATQKIEELCGYRVLVPSPPDALARDVTGFVEHLDQHGRPTAWAGTGSGTVFVRRWTITPLSTVPDRLLAIQVVVRAVARRGPAPPGAVRVLPGDVVLTTLRRGGT